MATSKQRKKIEEEILKIQKDTNERRARIDLEELAITKNNIEMQVWQKTLKYFPEDDQNQDTSKGRRSSNVELRHGSDADQARKALQDIGNPLYINDLLKAMGRSTDKSVRLSVASSIQSYARDGIIFKKTAPNTFGLLEWEDNGDDLV